MCRNIKTLANFAPPATDDEIRASAVQFVRKLSGTTHPSHANEAAFNAAVDEVDGAQTRRAQTHGRHVCARDVESIVMGRMPWLGFEPRRLAALPPQDSVSTSSTTRAGEET